MISNKASGHSKISPTAKITAYWKSLSNIPFSKEIAAAVKAEQTAVQMLGDRIIRSGGFSPSLFEARYKSINYGLEKSGMDNVMELACGLSPRGFEIISKGGIYVGTDLPEMHNESSKVIINIAKREGISTNNLYLQPANVLNRDELENAAAHFNGKKYAVCNEGLLPYLNKDEKAGMAMNVRGLLLKNDGVWVTTDISFKALREAIRMIFGTEAKKAIKTAMTNISEQTGINLPQNDFIDKAEALKFYEDLGFEIKEFPMYAGNYKLSTAFLIPDNLKEGFINILSSANVFVLAPKH